MMNSKTFQTNFFFSFCEDTKETTEVMQNSMSKLKDKVPYKLGNNKYFV